MVKKSFINGYLVIDGPNCFPNYPSKQYRDDNKCIVVLLPFATVLNLAKAENLSRVIRNKFTDAVTLNCKASHEII